MADLTPLRAEYPRRVERARALMQAQSLDSLLLMTGPNLVYFTGMPCNRSGSRPFVYLLPRQGEPVLIVHAGRQFEARSMTLVADIRTYTRLSHLPEAVLVEALAERGLSRGRLGLEQGGEMVLDIPLADFLSLQAALPGVTWVDASSLLWQLRMVKSPAEVARVARACAITSEAYARTFTGYRPGMTEAEVERLMVGHMLALGGSAPWVLATSGSGNYDLVSKGSGPRVIEPGDMVWMDCGCAVEGYWSDFSRAGVAGGPSGEQAEAQAAVHALTQQAVAMIRPGMPVAEIAAHCEAGVAALDLPITSDISGLASRVGHGLGMVVTELPSLNSEDPTRLAPGMIVTIEPGVATAFGTFHVEENVLVTDAGPRVLSAEHWQLWAL